MGDLASSLPPMRWRLVDGTQVTFLDIDVPIPDALWDQCMDARKQPEAERLLVVVAGDGFPQITHRQWRYSASIMIQRRYPVAILSSHRATLAIVQAANWSGAQIRAFRWAELDDALAFIGLAPERHPRIYDTLEQLASKQAANKQAAKHRDGATR